MGKPEISLMEQCTDLSKPVLTLLYILPLDEQHERSIVDPLKGSRSTKIFIFKCCTLRFVTHYLPRQLD